MCSTPKPRPKQIATRRYQSMSIDAMQRFGEVANAAEEKREQNAAEEKREQNTAEEKQEQRKRDSRIEKLEALCKSIG